MFDNCGCLGLQYLIRIVTPESVDDPFDVLFGSVFAASIGETDDALYRFCSRCISLFPARMRLSFLVRVGAVRRRRRQRFSKVSREVEGPC